MAYKIQFENGHTVEFESQPSDSDIEEAFAHTQKLSPKKEKADWGTALKTSFANLGNVADKSISTLAGSAAALFGDQKGAVDIEEGMREREAARNQWANPQGQELGFGGKLAGIPAGILAGGFSPVDTVDRLLQSGETTSDAITGGLIDAGGNAIGLIAPGFVKGGRLLQAGTGAAANAGQDVATKLAIQAVAETEKGKAQFQPTLEDAAVAAVAGGGFAALHPPQTKKPPTANKTVEAIRAAQEAKKSETVAGEDPAVIELAKQRAAEMQAKAQARPITVDSSGNAALDATKGPFVREDPMTRMVRELGGEPLPKETVTPDNAITRMAEDLTSEKTPESVWKAQEELDARQRALEEGVVAARKQDEAITDVSHRQMGLADEVRSRQVADAARLYDEGGGVTYLRNGLTKDDFVRAVDALSNFVNESTLKRIMEPPSPKNRARFVLMTPDEFHDLALKFGMGGPDQKKLRDIRKQFDAGNKLSADTQTIPWLTLVRHKSGLDFVSGHEGRHRAIVLKERGVPYIPVELRSDRIRWSEQAERQLFDYIENYPKNIHTQDAWKQVQMWGDTRKPGPITQRDFPVNQANAPRPFQFSQAGLGKKQGGAINLWQTPDPDSIVGRISRAFKEEGVDLIDQNLIPPNPELQSVIDTAKAEGSKGDGKFLKNFQSGSTSVAMKTRSPLLLAGSRIGQNALKMTDIHIRNYVMPAENAIRKLSKEDIQTLHEVMLEESRNREMTDRSILADHLSPDQLIAYDLIRKMQENQLEQVNAARKEKGLEPVDAHEAYLASRWQGDFRRPIYQKVGEDGKKLVWYLASNTKMGLERETKNLLKYAKENGIENLVVDASLDHQVHTSRNRTDLETAYSTMIDLLGRDDPAVKAMAELVEQAKAAEAYNAFGTKKHFENKAGIRGFVGDRPWKNPQKEAIAAFEEQFQQSKNAYSWAFTQKAVDGITKLASDPDLVKMQPKNVAFLRDYAKTLMGMSETKLAKALDDSFRSTGISPKLIQQGVGNLKSYFILTKLGASVGNMVVNTLQTANIPSYLTQMVGAGYRGNPVTSIATGLFGGIMMATAHYTPKTSRAMIPDGFLREAVDYAEANGVTARSIVDEAPVGSSKTIAGKTVRAVGHTLSGPETLARSVAFMAYAKMLESSGKFTKEQWPQMFQLAEEYTNKSMVDYRQTEHAMIYGKGGTVGKALNVLQTYPMSFWNQYSFMAREAAKGNPWGLLAMLPTHYLLAGVAGIPAAEALDKLYKLVKDNLLSTETWAELNESPFWRDPKAWLIDQMGQGYYGKLSVDTGINWTSRLGAPGPESMVTAPGGAAVELAQQGMAVGKALMDPTNSTKWAQAGMKTVPVALQGLLEQSGAMKDHTYVVKPETGERVYQKNTDLAAREGQYSRSPEEEKIRDFGLRSQKEVMTRDMMYSASREVKLGQQKASELPDRIYDAARRGDQQKANTLAALYMSISKDQNAGTTLEEAMKRAALAEYTTTEQKAALGIKESVNKAIAYARARKALESVK